MPKQATDYSKTIIYRIVCKDTSVTECYIGHTTNFTKRKYYHSFNCNHEKSKQYNFRVYEFIRENNGWNNWDMIEIEKLNCKDVNEAKARERYYIELYNSKLNISIPTQTDKEYYEKNRKTIIEYQQIYRQSNKELISNKGKEYYTNNHDKIQEYKKEFYIKNRENILEKGKEKIPCVCGCKIQKVNLKRHMTSQKHLNLISNL
jgi:hypothetical protein